MLKSSKFRRAWPIYAEINKLADGGLLREGLISHENGKRNLRKAYALALRTCRQAREWGKGFEQRHQRQHAAELTYEELSKEFWRIGQELSSLIARQGWSLIRHSVAGVNNRLSAYSIIRDVADLEERVRELSLAYGRRLKVDNKGGRPPDFWLLGFIWGAAIGWRRLTAANISSVGRFRRFVEAALDTEPNREPKRLTSAIKTAIKRLGMKKRTWLQPVTAGV